MKTISEQRIKDCLAILKKEGKGEIVKKRLEMLSFQLEHLLDEIEEFSRVVYCKDTVACYLDDGVLKMLSGSKYNDPGQTTLEKDQYYNSPSPASDAVLGRNSNGRKEWKYKSGKSIDWPQ